MTILGIFLCVISFVLIYKRLIYIFLGQCAKGVIIGYGSPIKSYKGVESYPYKVKYQYNNKEYNEITTVSRTYHNMPINHGTCEAGHEWLP